MNIKYWIVIFYLSIHCQQLEAAAATRTELNASNSPVALPFVWRSNFERGISDWPGKPTGWAPRNRSYVSAPDINGLAMRVTFPAGSIDPGSMNRRGLPQGGTGFKMKLPGEGLTVARLHYKVKFPADFSPGLGGKLPGLCGGNCNSGGIMPDGRNGFSARYMWAKDFTAEIYAYLPSSKLYGTPIGKGQIPLTRGLWIELIQEVQLNSVGLADGHIKVWVNGTLAINAQDVSFRTTESLKIDQVFVETFYGGNTDDWAAPKDTIIEFAEFGVWGK